MNGRRIDVLGLFFEDIGRHHALLSLEEEQALGCRIREGQQAARRLGDHDLDADQRAAAEKACRAADEACDRLVRCNIGLVIAQAKRFQGSGLPLEDLVQEGLFGLLRAIERFNPELGFKFSTAHHAFGCLTVSAFSRQIFKNLLPLASSDCALR
jgi:RNA polymerase primary sigma factor